MSESGLLAGSVGNLSLRVAAGVLITPTSLRYDSMTAADLVVTDGDGEVVSGSRAPSFELPLHLAIYRQRPDVAAVVHCHSPWAAAWSWLEQPLAPQTEEIEYYGIGPIATGERAERGSERLAATAVAALGSSKGALLSGHGSLAVGSSVEAAATVAGAIEHAAQVAWLIRLDGCATPLAAEPRTTPVELERTLA